MSATVVGYAFLGGAVPSFIWLYFLLKEDALHPEPKHLIAFAFIVGMCAVPIVLPIERYVADFLPDTSSLILGWALVEEFFKYVMAAVFILWRRQVDEAPDYVIYMITVALGFAAAENALFLADPLARGAIGETFLTGNLRFLGSTLLHVVASAAIGLTFAFSADFRPPVRAAAAALGLILAIALHTAFNALIIQEGTSSALAAFFMVWIVALVVLAAFEVLKYFQSRNHTN